jgi:putative ABC transport system permease protein
MLTACAVVLGVAAIIAIQITNLSTISSLTDLFDEASGKAQLVVVAEEAEKGGFPESALRQVAAAWGVAYAAPSLHVQTALVDPSPELRTGDAAAGGISLGFFVASMKGLLLYGIDPALDLYARQYRVVAGRFLLPGDDAYDVVLVKDFADAKKIRLGNDVQIATPDGIERLQVVGFMAKEGPGRLNNGDFGVLPLAAAQQIFGRGGDLDQIDVVAAAGASSGPELDMLKADLQARLGDRYSVTYPATQGRRVTQMLDSFQFGLSFFSGIALFVAAFLIYNAFSMTVVERTREIGMLRGVGMLRRQVLGLILIEAGLLGLFGSAVGIAAGLGLAQGLIRVMALFVGQEVRVAGVLTTSLVTAAVVGIGATLLAALAPAWQASRISPLEALRVRGSRRESWIVRRGWLVGLLLVLGAWFAIYGLPLSPVTRFRSGQAAVFAMLLGATLIIPATVSLWERLARPLIRRLYGNEGRLGGSNIQRARLRTALTAASLMVGVAMILGVRGLTGIFQHDIAEWIEAYLGSDLYVYSSLPMGGDLGRRLAAVEGVAAATPVRYLEARLVNPQGGRELSAVMFVDPATHGQVSSFVFANRQSDAAKLLAELEQGDTVFVASAIAERYGLKRGDKLKLETRRGVQEFTVAAAVVDFYNRGQVVQASWKDLRRYFGTDEANVYFLKLAPGYAVEEVRGRIDRLYGRRRHLTVNSNRSLKARAYQLADGAYRMFDTLGLIAVIVAAFGVVNTLTMNVTERTREIGALRGLGMTRGQVRRMILAEAGLMGLIGGVFGLAFGLFLSRVFLMAVTMLRGYELTYVLPVQGIISSLLLALVVSQLAAVLPARRAAGLRIVEAIQYE